MPPQNHKLPLMYPNIRGFVVLCVMQINSCCILHFIRKIFSLTTHQFVIFTNTASLITECINVKTNQIHCTATSAWCEWKIQAVCVSHEFAAHPGSDIAWLQNLSSNSVENFPFSLGLHKWLSVWRTKWKIYKSPMSSLTPSHRIFLRCPFGLVPLTSITFLGLVYRPIKHMSSE